MSRFSFRRPSHALAGILIAIGGCAEIPSAIPSTASGDLQVLHRSEVRYDRTGSSSSTASAVIDERGGTVVSPAGQTLVFPAGALAGPTQVSVTDDAQLVAVEIEPHGLVFPAGHEPVLTLNARGANIAGLNRAAVVYLDDVTNAILQVLPTQSSKGGTEIRAALPHFSKYAYAGS